MEKKYPYGQESLLDALSLFKHFFSIEAYKDSK